MTTDLTGDSDALQIRVNQFYRRCLKSVYSRDYYREVSSNLSKYVSHFDFAIGLGTAVGGGAGLGILANPRFAWLCGIATTVSLILTVAKSAYDWPSKVKRTEKMIENYNRLSSQYLDMVDEVNTARAWTPEFEDRYKDLLKEEQSFNDGAFPILREDAQRRIQNAIKQRYEYKQWWRWV